MPNRLRALAVCAIAALIAVGCATGRDAVTQGGTFEFVSPGGKTDLFYDPPQTRGSIGDLTGPALMDDRPIHLSDFAGKVVVINIWGSWCAPCRTETSELEKVFNETAPLGAAFVGIDVRDDCSAAKDFVTDRNVSYPSIFDPAMRGLIALGKGYPTSVVPTTLVLDRKHRVAAIFFAGAAGRGSAAARAADRGRAVTAHAQGIGETFGAAAASGPLVLGLGAAAH